MLNSQCCIGIFSISEAMALLTKAQICMPPSAGLWKLSTSLCLCVPLATASRRSVFFCFSPNQTNDCLIARLLRYEPEVGDVVVGRISEVGGDRWLVDIRSHQRGQLQLSSVNLPGGEQRRRNLADQMDLRKFYREGDIVCVRINWRGREGEGGVFDIVWAQHRDYIVCFLFLSLSF